MNKISTFILNNKFNLLLLIIWLFITIFTLNSHEIWRDEAQAWCIVRDSNLIDIFKMARIEGHPILWYLILLLPAKIGLNVVSMQILSLIFVFTAICFLIFKSPFNYFEKIIICFSSGLLYYLPIIARNYSLIPFLLFLLAIYYPKRNNNPIIFSLLISLLSFTHLYMLGFCIILAFYHVIENRKKILPSAILFLNFLILFCTFFNVQKANYALESDIRMGLSLSQILTVIPKVFTYNLFQYFDFAKDHYGLISSILFYPLLALFLFTIFKKDKRIAVIGFCSILYMFFVFTKVYFNGILYQKAYLIFLILIFCLWVIKRNNIKLHYSGLFSFYILFIISLIISPIVIKDEYKFNFSGGKEIAQYINKNLKDENIFIAVGNPYLYSSISAYLPKKKIYNIISENYISYYSYSNLKNEKKEEFPEKAIYSIIQEDVDVSENPYLSLVYKSKKENLSAKTEREKFDIYIQKL